ncbi:MAG: 1-acyl-sn-glycerol-3-phosphate acyltransferase [Chlamydiae bacterium]|nr:1-acyl-sn-glycerol-3-phosphate acyltransferase [Chlamydiota bacterium]
MSSGKKTFLFYKFSRKLVEIFFKLFYKAKVYGEKEHFIDGKALIAGNHVSYFDPPLVGVAWPEVIHYFARPSLFDKPVLGFLLRSYNVHPLSSKGALGALKLLSAFLKKGCKVVIFPEGTRSKEDRITDMKLGFTMIAQKNNCPIIPAYIHGAYDVWNCYRKKPKLSGQLACVFGTPLTWDKFEGVDRKQAQEEMGKAWLKSMENLKSWYVAGAKGSPP